ncbi:unnamed protein product [Medioppia subpectinata]|uniref:C2H2-type domain-containing protein n=1 Tax=Medioppia subpectinata TaxID=1979941 RepID=A0A7R9KDJ0_9ACAR|nr:unnamed protein product [Medioppia subpectinata]CAG2101115.1 unnamed protein product [Medioppia subpectinata]
MTCKCDTNEGLIQTIHQLNRQYETISGRPKPHDIDDNTSKVTTDEIINTASKHQLSIQTVDTSSTQTDSQRPNDIPVLQSNCRPLSDANGHHFYDLITDNSVKRMGNNNKLLFGEKPANDENSCYVIEIKEIKATEQMNGDMKNTQKRMTTTGGQLLATELLAQNRTFRRSLQSAQQLTEKTNLTNTTINERTVGKHSSATTSSPAKRAKGFVISLSELRRKPYPCRTCYQRFQTQAERAKHYEETHGRRPSKPVFKCLHCQRLFSLRRQYWRHKCNKSVDNGAEDNGSETTPQTSLVVNTGTASAGSSIATARPDQPFACPKCPFAAETPTDLQLHVKGVHRPKPVYECDTCSYRTVWEYVFAKHCKTHDTSNDFGCGVGYCPLKFVRELDLERHHNTDHTALSERVHRCEVCGADTGSRTDLRQHVIATHGFSCRTCGQRFFDAIRLAEHQSAAHSADKSFWCRVNGCDKRFDTKSSLEFHQRFIHSNQLLFVCDICEHIYDTEDEWTQHLPNHSQQPTGSSGGDGSGGRPQSKRNNAGDRGHRRPLKCNYPDCGQTFTNYYYLGKHKRTAHSAQDYVCHRFGCNRHFRSVEQLNYHLTSTYP